jgi:hypothetical protein
MSYQALIRWALATLEGKPSLAELLGRIDALNKSVPSLAELNAAFAELRQSGDCTAYDWSPVTEDAYLLALAHNRDAMVRLIESQGISPEAQAQILRWHASLWAKRER